MRDLVVSLEIGLEYVILERNVMKKLNSKWVYLLVMIVAGLIVSACFSSPKSHGAGLESDISDVSSRYLPEDFWDLVSTSPMSNGGIQLSYRVINSNTYATVYYSSHGEIYRKVNWVSLDNKKN